MTWGGSITGDFVGSMLGGAKDRQRLNEILREARQEVNAVYGRAIVPHAVDIFRGDSWQAYVSEAAEAPRVAVLLRAYFHGAAEVINGDTRVAIGVGAIESINPKRISQSHGEAFVLSGGAIDAIDREERLVLALPPSLPEALREALAASARLLDALLREWTAKQSMAVLMINKHGTQEKAARALRPPVTQPTLSKHLAAAHWENLDAALRHLAKALTLASPTR